MLTGFLLPPRVTDVISRCTRITSSASTCSYIYIHRQITSEKNLKTARMKGKLIFAICSGIATCHRSLSLCLTNMNRRLQLCYMVGFCLFNQLFQSCVKLLYFCNSAIFANFFFLILCYLILSMLILIFRFILLFPTLGYLISC